MPVLTMIKINELDLDLDETLYTLLTHMRADKIVGTACVHYQRKTIALRDQDARETVSPMEYAYVTRLYVRPDFRRKGIGAQLMARARDIAEARGCRRLSLSVEAANVPIVRAFYERLGFEALHRFPDGETLFGKALISPAKRDHNETLAAIDATP